MVETCFRLANGLSNIIVVCYGEEGAALDGGAGGDKLPLEGSDEMAYGGCVRLV